MRTSVRVAGGRLGVLLAGVMVTLGWTSPCAAQVRDVQRKDAYLGINLAEQCLDVTEGDVCDVPPIIRSLVVGGPADEAGVQMGDVLVSIDGVAVTTVEGRVALFNLALETPVELSLVRESDVVELTVVPAPLALERRVRFLPGSFQSKGLTTGGIRTMTIRERGRDEFGFTVEIEVTDEDETDLGESMGYVIVQTDSVGHTVIQVEDDPGTAFSWRYVVRDSELADRLKTARQIARVGARARIDTLLRMHDVMRRAVPDSASGVWFQDDARVFVGAHPLDLEHLAESARTPDVRRLFELRNRTAGAEFQVLSPQLAEYFPGVEAGLLVLRVIPGTPAAQVGLLQGDVVVEVGGEQALQMTVLQRALASPDRTPHLVVKWIRKGTEHEGTLSYP